MTCIYDIFKKNNELPKIEVEAILQFILKVDRAYLYTWPEKQLKTTELALLKTSIDKRKSGYPIAYITGEREFYSRMFTVSKSTLIPRHETERLIDVVLQLNLNKPFKKILDLGTGTGIIPITLAKELLLKKITACDISEDALKTCLINAKKHHIDIKIIKSNWFENINDHNFDLITSNPPYIESHDKHLAMGDLRFEPLTALSSGVDGLQDIAFIIEASKQYLSVSGYLVLEHGYNQAVKVQGIFKEQSFHNITTFKDHSNNDRITIGQI